MLTYIKSHSRLFLSSSVLLGLVACQENDTTSPTTDPMSANGSVDYAYANEQAAAERDFKRFQELEATKRANIQAEASKTAQDLTAEGQERGEEWRYKSTVKSQDEETKREDMRQSGQTKSEIFRGMSQVVNTVAGEGIKAHSRNKETKARSEGAKDELNLRREEIYLNADASRIKNNADMQAQSSGQLIGDITNRLRAIEAEKQIRLAQEQLRANADDFANDPQIKVLDRKIADAHAMKVNESDAQAQTAKQSLITSLEADRKKLESVAQSRQERLERDISIYNRSIPEELKGEYSNASAEDLEKLQKNFRAGLVEAKKLNRNSLATSEMAGRALNPNNATDELRKKLGLDEKPATDPKSNDAGKGNSPANNGPKVVNSYSSEISNLVQKAKENIKSQNEKLNAELDQMAYEDLRSADEKTLSARLRDAGGLTDAQADEIAKIMKDQGAAGVESAKLKASEIGDEKVQQIEQMAKNAATQKQSTSEFESSLNSIVGFSPSSSGSSFKSENISMATANVGSLRPSGINAPAKEITNLAVTNNYFDAKEAIPLFDESNNEAVADNKYLCDSDADAPCSEGAKEHLGKIASGIYEVARLKNELENTPSPNIQKVEELKAKIGKQQDDVSKMLRAANGSSDVGGRYSRSLQAMSNALSDAVQKDSSDFFSQYGSEPKIAAIYAPYKTKDYVGSMLANQPTACSRYGGGCGTQVAYNASSQPAIAAAAGNKDDGVDLICLSQPWVCEE